MSEPFLQELDWPLAHSVGVKVSLWREDLNHPGMSGNKLYKLKYHLNQARETGANQLVSMGGPWSNHLHAVAFAARECQIQSRGIIRGYHNQLSESLIDMLKSQMQLMFVSKQIFREIRAIGLNHPVISDLGSDIYFTLWSGYF